MRLFRFTSPASQAGIAMLSLPNDVMYIYLPSFGKERRISSSVKSQKFAGTDFSYDDMQAQPFSDKYNAKLIETTDKYYVLELTPKTKSAYSKIIAKIHKTEYYPISTDFYDQKMKKSKKPPIHLQKWENIGQHLKLPCLTSKKEAKLRSK